MRLIGADENTRAAYIVRNKISAHEIETIRREFDAKVVLFKVPPDECIRRLESDSTRPAKQMSQWRERVNEWWDEHRYLNVAKKP